MKSEMKVNSRQKEYGGNDSLWTSRTRYEKKKKNEKKTDKHSHREIETQTNMRQIKIDKIQEIIHNFFNLPSS